MCREVFLKCLGAQRRRRYAPVGECDTVVDQVVAFFCRDDSGTWTAGLLVRQSRYGPINGVAGQRLSATVSLMRLL